MFKQMKKAVLKAVENGEEDGWVDLILEMEFKELLTEEESYILRLLLGDAEEGEED